MVRKIKRNCTAAKDCRSPEAGSTLIEVLMASMILLIVSLGILPLIAAAVATNNRNGVDSTATMLTDAIIEQVKSTIIGSETSALIDCAGNSWTINTAPGGATTTGSGIDFTQASPPGNYYMRYVVSAPCTTSGKRIVVYDVRWHVEIVGSPSSPTNTYLVTVGVRQGKGQGNLTVSAPFNLRVMVGN